MDDKQPPNNTSRMNPRTIPATLALLNLDDLWPAWRLVDLMERHDHMPADEAQQWKDGIYGLMRRWGLEPDHLVKLGD